MPCGHATRGCAGATRCSSEIPTGLGILSLSWTPSTWRARLCSILDTAGEKYSGWQDLAVPSSCPHEGGHMAKLGDAAPPWSHHCWRTAVSGSRENSSGHSKGDRETARGQSCGARGPSLGTQVRATTGSAPFLPIQGGTWISVAPPLNPEVDSSRRPLSIGHFGELQPVLPTALATHKGARRAGTTVPSQASASLAPLPWSRRGPLSPACPN